MYLPAAAALLLVPVVVLAGTDQQSGQLATGGLALSYTAASFYPYFALAVFGVRVYVSAQKAPAAIVLAGTVLGGLPYLLLTSGMALPGPAGAYNLFFILAPIACVVALRPSDRLD